MDFFVVPTVSFDLLYTFVIIRLDFRDKPIARASPWQNGFAERLIGSIRREYPWHAIDA
jgi:hypothetical protein